MSTTTTRTPAVALSPSAWGHRWGVSTSSALALLDSMRDGTVVEVDGRWTLDPTFVARFASAFQSIELEPSDEDDDEHAEHGGRPPRETGIRPLPSPAPSSREKVSVS